MITSALLARREAEAVAIDYQLDGPRNAAAVARGESRLVGVAIAGGGVESSVVTEDIPVALRALGNRPRIYGDAILGRTIERVFTLPSAIHVDDVRIMRRLLEYAGLCSPSPAIESLDPLASVATIQGQFQSLPGQLLAATLGTIYAQIEIPVIDPVVDMIIHGLGIDGELLNVIESSAAAELEILRHQINEVAGMSINPDDDGQVADFLYDRCGLPVPSWTPRSGKPSVSSHALKVLGAVLPVVPCLCRYRDEHPIRQAARSLAIHISPGNGRVHGSLDPLGAVTGRFTCGEPNLQGLHRRLRNVVTAADGCVLVEADVSQAEYRVLAHFSREPTLLEAFAGETIDLHKQTMALALGKPVREVTDAERQIGKAVNFGIVYGETEYGLAKQLGVTLREADRFIEDFFRVRPNVRTWIEGVLDEVHQTGFVRTLFGRRRALPAIWSSVGSEVREAERQAVNTIIQGTAADLIKLAIARVHQTLPAGCRLLLTVHDSILVEAPVDRVDEVADVMRREMEVVPLGFSVPIIVDVKAGPTWGQCETL